MASEITRVELWGDLPVAHANGGILKTTRVLLAEGDSLSDIPKMRKGAKFLHPSASNIEVVRVKTLRVEEKDSDDDDGDKDKKKEE